MNTAQSNTVQQVTGQTDRLAILKAAADISDPGYGVWTYETWESHNTAYFGGELVPCPIQWGLTPHGHALGYFSSVFVRITLHTSLLFPRSDAWRIGRLLGKLFASDVLLHEMIHQAIFQRFGFIREDKPGASCHNDQHWVDEINRVASLLGLPSNARVVRQKRVNGSKPRWTAEPGCMSQSDLATWPHSARPANFYESAVSVQVAALLGEKHG